MRDLIQESMSLARQPMARLVRATGLGNVPLRTIAQRVVRLRPVRSRTWRSRRIVSDWFNFFLRRAASIGGRMEDAHRGANEAREVILRFVESRGYLFGFALIFGPTLRGRHASTALLMAVPTVR